MLSRRVEESVTAQIRGKCKGPVAALIGTAGSAQLEESMAQCETPGAQGLVWLWVGKEGSVWSQ